MTAKENYRHTLIGNDGATGIDETKENNRHTLIGNDGATGIDEKPVVVLISFTASIKGTGVLPNHCLVDEGLWVALGALAVLHTRSLRIQGTTRPMNHALRDRCKGLHWFIGQYADTAVSVCNKAMKTQGQWDTIGASRVCC